MWEDDEDTRIREREEINACIPVFESSCRGPGIAKGTQVPQGGCCPGRSPVAWETGGRRAGSKLWLLRDRSRARIINVGPYVDP